MVWKEELCMNDLSYIVVLAIISLAVCAVLLFVPLHLEDKNSSTLFAWVLCVVFLTNALSYATT